MGDESGLGGGRWVWCWCWVAVGGWGLGCDLGGLGVEGVLGGFGGRGWGVSVVVGWFWWDFAVTNSWIVADSTTGCFRFWA